ncbi:MAG: OmpH family outer membrane protein [Phycisphaerae bacterium]
MKRLHWTGILMGAAAAGVLTLATTSLTAQTPPARAGTRVAVVDVVKIFGECQRQKDLSEELKQLQEKLEAENVKRRQAIDALQATVDALDPNDPTRPAKTRELLARQIDYKNWFDLQQAAVAREVAVWTAKIYDDIVATTAAQAEKDGIDLVTYRDEFPIKSADPNEVQAQIRNRKVIYSRKEIDLTDMVLNKVDTDYRAKPKQPMLSL